MTAWDSVRRSVETAARALAEGDMIVVVDDTTRENEGDLIAAAATVSAEQMAFIVTHTTGIICTPMPASRCDELQLPMMVQRNTDNHETAFTVSVDHRTVDTGVSAADRTSTVRALSESSSRPVDFRRPGHIFPLRARDGGVLERRGHTEAAVDILRVAGLPTVGVISEIVADDGSMRRGPDLMEFAARHGLPVLTIDDLVTYRKHTENSVTLVAESVIPINTARFRALAYQSSLDDSEHLVLTLGDVRSAGQSSRGTLVRVHSECLTGDAFGSLRCDCGPQLEQALDMISREGCGVLVYLRGHEGRGIGLARKLIAYALQDDGMDTVDANLVQGLPADGRTYEIGGQILSDLGVRRVRLITNNPAKRHGLEMGALVDIAEQVRLPVTATQHNARYLRTKKERLGHELALPQRSGPDPRDAPIAFATLPTADVGLQV